MLDEKTFIAYLNSLVSPHLDCGDIVWGDQSGLKSEMDHFRIGLQKEFLVTACHRPTHLFPLNRYPWPGNVLVTAALLYRMLLKRHSGAFSDF